MGDPRAVDTSSASLLLHASRTARRIFRAYGGGRGSSLTMTYYASDKFYIRFAKIFRRSPPGAALSSSEKEKKKNGGRARRKEFRSREIYPFSPAPPPPLPDRSPTSRQTGISRGEYVCLYLYSAVVRRLIRSCPSDRDK